MESIIILKGKDNFIILGMHASLIVRLNGDKLYMCEYVAHQAFAYVELAMYINAGYTIISYSGGMQATSLDKAEFIASVACSVSGKMKINIHENMLK